MTATNETPSPSMARQRYIEATLKAFGTFFDAHGYTVPDNVRISVGFPRGSHGGKKAIGQCWSNEASKDGHYEIFISPELGEHDTVNVLTTIAHEAIHATCGTQCGHKGAFKKMALAVGFVTPMTTTPAGPEMLDTCRGIIRALGEYPAGAIASDAKRKKQTTRMLKCECGDCGYIARVTRSWVEKVGTPLCPADQVSMKCDAVDDEDGVDDEGEW